MDWTNLKEKVSKFFTVKELIWLPSWSRAANEEDGLDDSVKENLQKLAEKMDLVREFFGKPILVHVTYRPSAYNKAIKGAPGSAHQFGQAMDFSISGMKCDDIRKALVNNNLLEKWEMRCENAPGTNWVHLDIRKPGPGGRFFKP